MFAVAVMWSVSCGVQGKKLPCLTIWQFVVLKTRQKDSSDKINSRGHIQDMPWPSPGSVRALEENRSKGYFGGGSSRLTCKAVARWTGERCRAVVVKGREFCRLHGGNARRVPTDPRRVARNGVRRAVCKGLVPAHVLALPIIQAALSKRRRRSLAAAVQAEQLIQAYLSQDHETWARVLAQKSEN
jgi:hypothetical protein